MRLLISIECSVLNIYFLFKCIINEEKCFKYDSYKINQEKCFIYALSFKRSVLKRLPIISLKRSVLFTHCQSRVVSFKYASCNINPEKCFIYTLSIKSSGLNLLPIT